MPLRLPPLSSLRLFEAAGRHQSFKLAARTLVETGARNIVAQTAYWLVASEGADHRPDLSGFKQWLLGEAIAAEDRTITSAASPDRP